MCPFLGLTHSSRRNHFHLRDPGRDAVSHRILRSNWQSSLVTFAFLIFSCTTPSAWAQTAKTILPADERYKVDILVVVAHPDDEGAATPYLARAMDEGKRVAVAYGTRGSSGENQTGAEQAMALGDIREIQARRADAVLG